MKQIMSMKRVIGAALIVLTCGVAVFAQAPAPPGAPAAPKPALVPLRAQLVIARYQGEKKVENLPFSLMVMANGNNATFSNAHRVRMPEVTTAPGGPTTTYSWQNVGTNITVRAETIGDGNFHVNLTVSDSALVPGDQSNGNLPTTKSLSLNNNTFMRDGQTAQFIAATDKVTGDQTRVELTLNVVK